MTRPPKGLPSPTAWLWWAALVLFATGIAVTYMVSVFATGPDQEGASLVRLVMAVFISLTGVCIICATAGWWIRR